MASARVLVADDDTVICDMLCEILHGMRHETMCAYTAEETVGAVGREQFDLVLLDLKFPDCRDLSTLAKVRETSPDTSVVIVTAESDDLRLVAEAVRLGAFDYVPKPIRPDDIRIRVTRVMEARSLARMHEHAVAELADGRELDDIVGDSLAIRSVVKQAGELAAYDLPVLVTGETGTGKELVARALHYGGPRRAKPFVPINCASLPRELTESELFGHEKGAFTGAHVTRKGAFEEATDGTLFLDEVGDMDLASQATLLRVLETGLYRSVGGREKRAAARIVIATNQDLEALVAAVRFRKDLFYRINRTRIVVPPLRERRDDIPALADYFLRRAEAKVGKGVKGIEKQVMDALVRYEWPGNVRELRNEVERAYIRTERDAISMLDLSVEVAAARAGETEEDDLDPTSLDEMAKLIEALRVSAGNVTKAAAMLGVHRNTVHRWIKRYSLQ